MAGKKHKVQGLRRRWLTGSMGPVLVILLLVGVLISVGFASNYYNSARSTLRAKAAAGADYFNTYVMTSYREYYRSATIYAAAFDDSDKIELQFLNSSGRVEVTTRGVTTGTYPSTPEILRALESGTVQDYIGRDSVTGERILAVSGLLKFNGQVVGVMRYVTAIGNIDRQVLLTVLLVAGVMLAVVGLIVMSSMIFINNVVAPVSAVSEAAKRISGGSYGVQIPNKYSDEMGELVDNINDMSRKIGESERMKSEFISSVSHELRTPLTAINGWGETLLADDHAFVLKLKDTVRAAISEARFAQAVNRMRESTTAMLDTKKLPAIVKLASSSFGITEDESNGVLEHLITGGDFSLYGLANAVTRFSQDVESYDRATKLEEIGYSVMTMSPALFRQMNQTELLAA